MPDSSPLLTAAEISTALNTLPGWVRPADSARIEKEFRFKNFHQTMAFVNALAWIAHRQDHHPDLEVGYNRCKVMYTTHSAGGITQKDLDAAIRIEMLESA